MNLDDAKTIASGMAGKSPTDAYVYVDQLNDSHVVVPSTDGNPDRYKIYIYDEGGYRIAELRTPNIANLWIYTMPVPPARYKWVHSQYPNY
jgi:hypothetical protein